jgi:hypothetical protein
LISFVDKIKGMNLDHWDLILWFDKIFEIVDIDYYTTFVVVVALLN